MDFLMIFLNHFLQCLLMTSMFMQQNMMLMWATTAEMILFNDTLMENYIIYTQYYLYEKYIRRQNRSIWMKNRYIGWWEEMVPRFSIDEWMENFRMSRNTFNYICKQLKSALAPKYNPLMPRVPLTVEKQVAIALFYYASCCECRVVGHLFGVHRVTVWKCVHRVTAAINNILMPIWISLPNENESEIISREFQKLTGMPQIIGAIDGSHIPILPPSDGYRDFINRKGWSSYVLQGVVDHNLMFRNINIESPGCTHDSIVLQNSTLFTHYRELMPQKTKIINNTAIPYLLIGDAAYPSLPWLIKGFVCSRNRTNEQESFNVYLNSGRYKVEIAFGRLKSRWRRICKRIDCHYTFAPEIISACCVLHNIVESRKETFKENWNNIRRMDELLFPQPEAVERINNPYDSDRGKLIRNVLLRITSLLPRKRSKR